MAMLTSVRGRVEADPMRIPAPTRSDDRAGPFAAVLDRVVQDRPVDAVEPRPQELREETPAAVDEAVEAHGDELPVDPRPADDAGDETGTETAGDATETVATAEVTETLRRGESDRREDAGKGADSPRTSSPKAAGAEPLLAAVAQRGGPDRALPVGPFVAETGVAAAGATKAGDAPTRGFDAGQLRAASPARAAAVTPGYRTTNAASAEMLEQARDSVFKQILMQLDATGGEMRVRLQPPDLGELDLRLVVEHGNKLTLTIAAERADLTQLLQKHLDELKQTLQASGLEITDAQVQQRSAGSSGDHPSFPTRSRQGASADEAQLATQIPRRGWVSAEGLDFWA